MSLEIRTYKINKYAGCQWLMPIMLATQKIKRIIIQSQCGANSSQDPISKKQPSPKKKK
jgi:hypothetical protein